ncbi:MAG: DUF2087 domain-containing protein [Sphaerochaeta sp.]|nr:DUF2087 domain-containing protein [Sphaerochaeta sp.]
MDLDTRSVDAIKQGYRFDEASRTYRCDLCGAMFEEGEVFPVGGRFFEASRAIRFHVETGHPDRVRQLLYVESKYNTLTENQKALLGLMYANESDKEIARRLDISPSTVRHQRFTFREKAKQAKLFLAIYELVAEKKETGSETMLPILGNVEKLDDRFVITEGERDKVLQAEFASLAPLKLKRFPGKEKKKIVVLAKIAELLEKDKRYSEKELNTILSEIYDDHAIIRRYLVDYGFMQRTENGSAYWLA